MIDAKIQERDEIEMLLPWYETGRLSAAEMRRVEAYLRLHPEMTARLALIREELAETIAGNEMLGMPNFAARDRLMAQIAADAGAMPHAGAGLKAWWTRWLPEGLSPGLALAAAAAVLVILVQAAALISLNLRDAGDDGYRVASGKQAQSAEAGTLLLIRFAETASAGEIAALLQSVGGTIVDGPKPGGMFKLRVSPRILSNEERDMILAKLREKTDIVTFLAPAG